jgi:hypothetical protein
VLELENIGNLAEVDDVLPPPLPATDRAMSVICLRSLAEKEPLDII